VAIKIGVAEIPPLILTGLRFFFVGRQNPIERDRRPVRTSVASRVRHHWVLQPPRGADPGRRRAVGIF